MSGGARQAVDAAGAPALAAGAERARRALEPLVAAAAAEGMPLRPPRGRLIRPLAALCGLEAEGEPPGFWRAVLAVQLAHEASLVHDDIVDAARTRRGEPAVAAVMGVGPAVVHGDHLLTAAYRMAADTGSLAFAAQFARAVERTVAGEVAQGRATGRVMEWEEYREIALGKAGELLGCAVATAPTLAGSPRAAAAYQLGRRLGLLYQMLDDLLDYCPAADTGKPALGDYAQRRWTWPLLELGAVGWHREPRALAETLRAPGPGGSALRRCLAQLEAQAEALLADARAELAGHALLAALVEEWLERVRSAVDREERDHAGGPPPPARPAPSGVLRERVPDTGELLGYFARNSRSFRFAARFFPRADAERVARVYAYCRVTDDLVDRPVGPAEERAELLTEWVELSRRAYQGEPVGLPFLERVMGEMAERAIPFRYADELAEGMRMDLRGESYATMADLRRYTYRVASVVGLWLTELAGVREPRVLRRAAALGHAMQLTNILRDVGEDARRGRLYLPLELLRRHGVERAEIERMCAGRTPIGPGYRALLEELMEEAERSYAAAFRAIPCLPPTFRRPVAVAALVYRGIHREIRRNGHDNLRRRAVTPPAAKAVLAARALWQLQALRWRAADPLALLELAPVGADAVPGLLSATPLGRER